MMPSSVAVADRPPTILVVDDEPWNRTLVDAILGDHGYRVLEAANGPAALDVVSRELPDAVLLDIMMPGMDGFEVCRRLKGQRHSFFVPVVMLTALSDLESKIQGLDSGADEFLNKPINRIELIARLRSLLRIRRLRDELDSADRIMLSMVTALEGKRAATRDHSLRVATLAAAAAETLGLDSARRETVVWGALLHDLGKIGVPDEVLEHDPEGLVGEALEAYRRHPAEGDRLLASLASLAGARPIVRHHHERLDGSGYPDGLRGDAFSLPIEIVAVANAFDNHRAACPDDPGEAAARLLREGEAGRFRRPVVDEVLLAARSLSGTTPTAEQLLPAPVPPVGGTVRVADDSPGNRELYEALLGQAGYTVHTHPDGESLLAALRHQPCDLALIDIKMPGLDGQEVCRRIKSDPAFERLSVVLVTAHRDAAGKERALASGADDFLTLPIDRQELLARVRSLLRLRAYHLDLERHETVVLSLSELLEAKDPYTRGHSQRVGRLARRLGEGLGLAPDQAEELHTAGLLHDIGKVAIPERILHKAGPLDDDEWAELETHPVRGWEICQGLRSLAFALPAIRHHHERWDGSGYPDALAGESIPRSARIMGVADAFDALTSERPYRARMSTSRTLEILRRETENGKWDPDVMAALLAFET